MNITELKKYRQMVKRLTAVEQALEQFAVTDSVEGSKGAPSFEKTTRQVEGYPHTERVCQLIEQRRWLRAYIRSVEDQIFSIEDERICEALILYCIDERIYAEAAKRAKKSTPVRVTWENVAEKMGEPSGEAIRKAVFRYVSGQL